MSHYRKGEIRHGYSTNIPGDDGLPTHPAPLPMSDSSSVGLKGYEHRREEGVSKLTACPWGTCLIVVLWTTILGE